MENLTLLADKYSHIITIAHVFFVVLGMGSALLADILFSVYIKDRKISDTENYTLNMISRVVWISLGFISLTGLLVFLSDPNGYLNSTKFIAKVIIVGVIIVNGFLFWKITHKSLQKINFSDTDPNDKYVKIRKLSFAFGAVSMVSWLCVFLLGSVPFIPLSFLGAMLSYVALLIIGIIGSQIYEYLVVHRKFGL